MNPDPHARYADDLAAYLLGALPPGEAHALETHLESCERCRERERWLRSAVDLLPSSVEQLQPPPELKQRLMATVLAEAEPGPAVAAAPQTHAPASRPRLWERLSLGLRPATAALAAAFILGAGIAGFVIGSEGDGGEGGTITVIRAQTGQAALIRDDDHGILQVERLRPRAGSVYQAWIARAGQDPTSAGVFDVGSDGRGWARIRNGLDTADEVLVTPEPPGGSLQPTSDPVLRVRV